MSIRMSMHMSMRMSMHMPVRMPVDTRGYSSSQVLPLGALVGRQILVVHGGIGDGQWRLSDIEEPGVA